MNEEKKINELKIKIPLRNALRVLIKENKLYNNINENIKINKEEKDLINEINKSKEYKSYFSEKYGNGNYLNFITKYKKGQLNYLDIKKEFEIISNIIYIFN